jgi:hypothetical protein
VSAQTVGGVTPINVWWTHPIDEADSTGNELTFEPALSGSYMFIAHALDAVGQTASDTVYVTANDPPAQFCWVDSSMCLLVNGTTKYDDDTLTNPEGLYYVLLRITYKYDPRTGFDVILSNGTHIVYEIIDPYPNRTGTQTIDILLPVQFWFEENQKIAFTYQSGASGTSATLIRVTGCTQYPVPTDGIPMVIARLVAATSPN